MFQLRQPALDSRCGWIRLFLVWKNHIPKDQHFVTSQMVFSGEAVGLPPSPGVFGVLGPLKMMRKVDLWGPIYDTLEIRCFFQMGDFQK